MSLRSKYILFIVIIHSVFVAALIFIHSFNKIVFVVGEAFLILSIVLSIWFLNRLFRPFKILYSGTEAISDKDFSSKILPVGQKELDQLIDVYNRMIIELRQERTHTAEKNFFLEKLINASPAGIIILNKKNDIQFINLVAQQFLNLKNEELNNFNFKQLPQPWQTTLNNLLNNNIDNVLIEDERRYKCHKSHFIDKGVKQHFFMIEELTQELLNAQRKSYEKVVRMMAHEVNNSIGASSSIIDSTVEFLNEKQISNADDYIIALKTANERLENLNKFTSNFSRIVQIPKPSLTKLNIKELIEKVLIILNEEIKNSNISIIRNYCNNQMEIEFDYNQLEQVLINIFKNAIQAIQNKGKIWITTKAHPMTLSVSNNGIPIKIEDKVHLFDPFFTTKKNGQGIGLTLIREILTNHGCEYSLQTDVEGKTTFKIVFS